ncbi:hypothetical protein GCM10011344_05820 [Dokdonia pacifica]|uniref:Uncharacterized protein n=1 Tax=Dokdonia pacifica TaxID=1627892 RepID=A0A238ZR20_9FLAO|nr:hypothetical protein [Dokdonia pacifica]GGG08097.1 hypothetical protein GCM10011344_05820 [Dokdonia pacifica]SNR85815.1 hypothetical protein SAMN06265376_103450 [Dokdonia pacifica]
MIRFLRKVRHKLVADNKVGKYLIYALGEIILVVIGILIAVAINNSQQNKVLQKKEQTYLKGLKSEFVTSRLKLAELIDVNKQNYLGAKKILEDISNPSTTLTEKEFSELLFKSFSFDISFNANNSLLNEMINSGSLKDISNDQLRIYLTNWVSTIEDISGQEKELGIQRAKVLDMFRTDKNSIRTILEQTSLNSGISLSKREQSVSNLNLLESLEFENNILMFYLTSQATEQSHYIPLMKQLNLILYTLELEIR